MSKSKLNHRQKNFVDNLLKGMNQTKAYKQAGYESTGTAARVNASKLIRKDKIQEELKRRREERINAVRSQITQLLTGALKTHNDIMKLDTVSELSDDQRKTLKLKLKSAKDILDRCNIGDKDKNMEINVNQTQVNQESGLDKLREYYEKKKKENLEKQTGLKVEKKDED